MLRPAEMKGFRAIIPQSTREDVISLLHEVGVANFREITLEDLERGELEEEFYEINSLLGNLEEVQEFFKTTDLEPKQEISLEFNLESARDLLRNVEPKKEELAIRLRNIEEKSNDLLAKKETLSDLLEIDVPLKYLRSTKKIEITVGKINEEELDEFLEAVRENLPEQVFATSFGQGIFRIIVLVCRKEVVSELRPIQYRFGVESLDLPPSDKTPKEFLENIEEKLEELEDEKEKIDEEIKEFRKKKGQEINALTEYLEIEQERRECISLFGRTDSTTVIEGWSPEKEIVEIEDAIKEGSDGAYVMRTYEPSESDIAETPVKLENPKYINSYEYLTEMYSLPSYNSTDPTVLVAISFSLFFGFTLSDAGYGLVLLVLFISGFSIIKNLFSKRLRYIMIAGAAGTIFAGALFGSWFGAVLGDHFSVFAPYWTDPIYNPIPFLKLVVYFGILHLAVGFAIGGSRKSIIRKDWRRLIFHNIGNTLLILGLFALAFCVVGLGQEIWIYFPEMGIFEAFSPLSAPSLSVFTFKGMFYGGLILAIIGQLVEKGKPTMSKVGGAIDTLYSIIGYISDVVSYTRLLALGIATSVIALVINKIGYMFYGALFPAAFSGILSYLQGAVAIIGVAVVLIFGHVFNIFINSITGFVHTMRLHYAEFFQTFYEGGGKKYSPFKLIRKYT